MDTQWFALDEQGHVGVFDTGEDGALPNQAAFGMAPTDSNFDEDELTILRIAHALANGKDPIGDWRPPPTSGRTLVVIDLEDADRAKRVLDVVPGRRFVALNQAAPFLFLSQEELSIEEVEELRAESGVRWTFDLRDSHELFGDPETDDGLFHFTRDHGEDPGLYTLARAPESPLEVPGELKALRSALGRLQFPLDYAEAKQVHLADHLSEGEWETWGDLPLRYTAEDLAEMEREDARLRERNERRNDPELQQAKTRLIVLVLLFVGVLIYLWLR